MNATNRGLAASCRRGILVLMLFAGAQVGEAQEGPITDHRLPTAPRMPVKPSRVIEFTTQEGSLMTLDVSPDGKSLVFDLAGHIYTLPIDGGKARRITQGMFFDWHPRYSPDGRQILFLSDRDGFANMHVMNADGSDVRRVSTLDRAEEPWFISPEWMPDGKSVVAGFLRGMWTHRGGAPDSVNLFQFPLEGGRPTEFVLGSEDVLGIYRTRVENRFPSPAMAHGRISCRHASTGPIVTAYRKSSCWI
jgi:Tol biopolymer transport system component